jgi:hypothetical protein
VLPLYLLTFPADGARQQLVERTRHLDAQTLRRWLSETDEAARERKRKPRG